MEMLALLLVFPLVWPFVAKMIWKHEITLGELAANIVIVVLVVAAGGAGGRYAQTADHEVLNGQVTGKTRDRVACEHSYQCRCRPSCSGTGSSQTCTEVCDTCYDHSYDIDWNLHTTLDRVKIRRVDRQGMTEPPRWTRAAVGDPVAQTNRYTNYIKGAPESLFSAAVEQTTLAKHEASLPAYPLNIHDLHYLNRVLVSGVVVPDLAGWNQDLALRLRTMGPARQANVVVVMTKSADPSWAEALRVKWLGGKKNDVIVVMGAPDFPKTGWVRVLSWTDKELFKVQLRDDLQALPEIERTAVLGLIEKHVVASFVRKPMKDFDYLANQIQPPGWLIGLLFVVSVVGSIGLSLYFARNRHRTASSGAFGPRRVFR